MEHDSFCLRAKWIFAEILTFTVSPQSPWGWQQNSGKERNELKRQLVTLSWKAAANDQNTHPAEEQAILILLNDRKRKFHPEKWWGKWPKNEALAVCARQQVTHSRNSRCGRGGWRWAPAASSLRESCSSVGQVRLPTAACSPGKPNRCGWDVKCSSSRKGMRREYSEPHWRS